MRNSFFFFFCIILACFGYGIFLKGFLTYKSNLTKNGRFDTTKILSFDHPEYVANISSIKPTFGRLVFVLIDALRADFVLPLPWGSKGTSGLADNLRSDLPSQMDYVQRLIISGEARAYLAKAHPPTVTMPRIKVIHIDRYTIVTAQYIFKSSLISEVFAFEFQ